MKLYEENLIDFTEVDNKTIIAGLEKKTIVIKERLKKHHVIPEENKRVAKTTEEVFNELMEQGIPVTIHNGIYCKIIYNTFEAINPIPAIDDWDEYEEVFVKGGNYGN